MAWLIAGVAVAVGVASCRSGSPPGLSWTGRFVFAVGLLVANVPEGLLPTITLALAGGVRSMAQARRARQTALRGGDARLDDRHLHGQDRHADRNAMHVAGGRVTPAGEPLTAPGADWPTALPGAATADLESRTGDPTELALLDVRGRDGVRLDRATRDASRVRCSPFDPGCKMMATVDRYDAGPRMHVKGAPEEVLPAAQRARRGRSAVATAAPPRSRPAGRELACGCCAAARRATDRPGRSRDRDDGRGPG